MTKMLELEEEKNLLKLKGEALRMKLSAHSRQAKIQVYQPINRVQSLGSLLSLPVVRSLAVSLLGKRLLSAKGITYAGLGLTALWLLRKQDERKES